MNRRTAFLASFMGGLAALVTRVKSQEFNETIGGEKDSNAPTIARVLMGGQRLATAGDTVTISSSDEPVEENLAVLSVNNFDTNSCGLRVRAYWEGGFGQEYQNHDCSLYEVFNTTTTDSLNRSWAVSACNAINDIPAGVTDSGTRVGILGWATSISYMGYKHEGVLNQQVGVSGTAGFQSVGSGESAIVNESVGVRGVILNGSKGSTIKNAIAGQFVTRADDGLGPVLKNTAVYASARGGTQWNYSFFGGHGQFFNADQLLAGSQETQSKSSIAARKDGNSLEFGHPDRLGYASNLGATQSRGLPFVAFCAEADPTGDTFTTRGKLGAVVSSDLAGALVFSRLTGASASGQSLMESARIDPEGHLVLSETPMLKANTPVSALAPGKAGEVCWDEDYVYVCVAADTWKRTALSIW